MNLKPLLYMALLTISAMALGAQDGTAAGHARAVAEPELFALDLVQPAWLNGPSYSVEPQLHWQGSFAEFTLMSDFGALRPVGVEMLAIRVEEFAALAELNRVSKLKAFRKSASRTLSKTGQALKNIFTRPIETVKALPDAVSEKAKQTYDSVREGAKNLADQAREGMRNQDGDPVAPNPFLPPPSAIVTLTEAEQAEARSQRAKQVAADFGLDYFGYGRARRELAKLLGVDPYTSNPLIHSKLDELAWAGFVGSKGTGLTMGALTGGASVVLSRSRQINRLVWELPEEDLRKRNRKELKSAGFVSSRARAFLRNGAFSASTQTSYTDLMLEMARTKGKDNLLDLGASARDEVDARYLIHCLELALANGRPIVRVRSIHSQLVFESGRRGLIVPIAADYLRVSAETLEFLELEEFRNTDNQVLYSGKLSASYQAALESRGWAARGMPNVLNVPYAN